MALDVSPQGTLLVTLPSPFPFVIVEGQAALSAMADLRASWQDASPVILGTPEQAERLIDLFEEDDKPSPPDTLALAQGHTFDALFEEREAAWRESVARWHALRGDPPATYERTLSEDEAPRGGWPTGIQPREAPLALFDPDTGRVLEEVVIALMPTSRSYETAAYTRFGGWNECPQPHFHVAIGREWARQFGARLIINTPNVIEYEVASPVGSREEALALAHQQYRYCRDIVRQGTGTIDTLAAMLLGSRYWLFWWD